MTAPLVPDSLSDALADRYPVERELGQGGMATVYLAHDLKHDRKVAVKVLRPELAAVLGAERFLAEIKVTANLQHPNLLPLFDSGRGRTASSTTSCRTSRARPCAPGSSASASSRWTRPFAWSPCSANALAYAHAHGVIHRDLKPENILLQSGQPVIADFGIALAVAQAGGTRVTETGLSLGTPHYMSPEQAAGEREIDARSDQYALAAVTYEMLSGEPPHTGPTAQAIIARLMTEQVAEPARHPARRAGSGGSRGRAGAGQVAGGPVRLGGRLRRRAHGPRRSGTGSVRPARVALAAPRGRRPRDRAGGVRHQPPARRGSRGGSRGRATISGWWRSSRSATSRGTPRRSTSAPG